MKTTSWTGRTGLIGLMKPSLKESCPNLNMQKPEKITKENDSTIQVLYDDWNEYELIDSGNGKKLERFGEHILVRGETKAWWPPELSEPIWNKAVAFHPNEEPAAWMFWKPVPREWTLHFDALTLQARLTATSKHVGIFPEQAAHWRWMRNKIRYSQQRDIRLLNLFGYTGIASLVAAAEGCRVTHVDAAKGVVTWARENQQLSRGEKWPIRWIVDDVVKFVRREIRRGKHYDAIVLDPPAYGRGPKGELWKIEDHLVDLLSDCRVLLSENPLFIILTMYSIEQSAVLIQNLLEDMMQDFDGSVEVGELALKPKKSKKILSMSIFGRWEQENAKEMKD